MTCTPWSRRWRRARTTAEWVQLLDKAQIPNAPVSRPADLFDDPHLVWRQLFKKYPHPSEGEIMMVEPPMRMSRTPPAIRTMAPLQGAHSRAVLAEAGLSAAEIEALKKSGALIEPTLSECPAQRRVTRSPRVRPPPDPRAPHRPT